MPPKHVVKQWITKFNEADIEGLMELYAEDAVNHQVVAEPLIGKAAIRTLFKTEFARAKMNCIEENLLE